MSIGFLLGLTLAVQAATAAPAAPAAPLYTPASCEDPVARKLMLAGGAEGFPAVKAVKVNAKEGQARMIVLVDRLAERGKLTNEQKGQIAVKMLESPAFRAAHAEGGVILSKMVAKQGGLTGKDDAISCRIIMSIAADFADIDANVEKQWNAMKAVLDGEAARLGVSLAD